MLIYLSVRLFVCPHLGYMFCPPISPYSLQARSFLYYRIFEHISNVYILKGFLFSSDFHKTGGLLNLVHFCDILHINLLCFVHPKPLAVFKVDAFSVTGYLYIYQRCSYQDCLIFIMRTSCVYYRHNKCTSNKLLLTPKHLNVVLGHVSVFFFSFLLLHLISDQHY
jgi:hypothetical protein